MARLIESIKGHQEVWQTLLKQVERQHLPHALAFTGSAGIGKKKVAWALAQALLCEISAAAGASTPAIDGPCGQCPACRRVAQQQSESVLFLEPEKNVIKLEAAQGVLQFLNLQRISRARIVIIDSAQVLNPQAGNSLLKAIEEPPEQTYFILIVNEISQLLPTLRSRVQMVRFTPLSDAELQDSGQPQWMVRSARGSLAQLESFMDTQNEGLRRLTLAFLAQSLGGSRQAMNDLLDQTKDRQVAMTAVQFLQQFLRDWSLPEASDVIHVDLLPEMQLFPERNVNQKIALWQKAFAMETDLNAHVDRTLLFETFFAQAARGN